ncbi:MAG: S8 family serine peptidase [Chloroflexota bacterium]|nr:S8 family serine peptidase [Chloroflexota bacterium]
MRWLLFLSVWFAFSIPPSYAQDVAPAGLRTDADTQAALADAGTARVIVNLRESAATRTPAGEPNANAIAALQADVIASVRGATRGAASAFQVQRRYSHVPAFSATVDAAALAALTAHPSVSFVEYDQPTHGHTSESVPALNADDVHALGYTGAGVRVAVVDSGVRLNHPDLAPSIIAQQCFTQGNCAPSNTNTSANAEDVSTAGSGAGSGHGTNVSGIITSDGIVAPKGFAPGAQIIPVRVLNGNNSGFVSDWVAGLNWLIANQGTLQTDIINMSLGTFVLYNGSCEANQSSTHNAIQTLVQTYGVIVFASSGNQGDITSISSPACLPSVLAVGATYDSSLGREPDSGTYQDAFGGFPACFDANATLNTITCFTNSNAMVDILAPGRPIRSAGITANTSTFSGTSQASPTGAGIAALLLEYAPYLTPVQIEQTLENTGIAVTDTRNGVVRPRIDALAAFNAVIAANMVANADFANPAIGNAARNWGTFGSPNPDSIQWNIQSGVFQFYRPPGSDTAVVLQNTQTRLPAGSLVKVDIEIGNSTPNRQRATLLVHDSDFSDLQVCTFWLPAGTPLRLYTMYLRTTEYWNNASLSVYASSTSSTGYLRIDNAIMRFDTVTAVGGVLCIDPDAPDPTGSPDSGTLLSDGSFTVGAIGSADGGWGVFSTPNHTTESNLNIAYQVSSGVFEFYRKNRPGISNSAVVLQYSQDSLPAGTTMEAVFQLGNSTANRARITVLLHTRNFIDLAVCTFWLAPNAPLSSYSMYAYTTQAWDAGSGNDASISFYNSTAHASGWMRVDNVSLIATPSSPNVGTECYAPGGGAGAEAVIDPALIPTLMPTATPGFAPYVAPGMAGELPLNATPTAAVETAPGEGSTSE